MDHHILSGVAVVVLEAQTAAVWFMTGFIWVMQVLHYPLFALVGDHAFPAYEQVHNRRFALLVAPGVVVTLATTVWLLASRPVWLPLWAPIGAAVLLVVVLVSTVGFQAPAHGRLAGGFDAAVHRSLVRGNWVRTAAWTALGVLDLWMLGQAARG